MEESKNVEKPSFVHRKDLQEVPKGILLHT